MPSPAAAATARWRPSAPRDEGRELGLPERVVDRHPFPGPGLAIRIPGEVTRAKLDILRKADAVFLEEIRSAGLYEAILQAFAVLPRQANGASAYGQPHSNSDGVGSAHERISVLRISIDR